MQWFWSYNWFTQQWEPENSYCSSMQWATHLQFYYVITDSKLGVGRVQIIWVDYSRTKNRLDIEHSRSLVSTITGTNIQYGGSRKQ